MRFAFSSFVMVACCLYDELPSVVVFDCLLLVQRCLLFVLPVLSVSALKLRGLRIVVSRGTIRYVTVEYISSVILLLYKGAAGL